VPPTPIEERLRFLHEHYIERINMAVADNRMDLVRDLANSFEDEALALMLDEGDTSNQWHGERTEILEFGGWPRWRGVRRLSTWGSWFRRRNR
jgi:hypothetical protein